MTTLVDSPKRHSQGYEAGNQRERVDRWGYTGDQIAELEEVFHNNIAQGETRGEDCSR